ncbi:hypothetical protein BH09PSE4_BH09PSE4_08520 [soil metagenome]
MPAPIIDPVLGPLTYDAKFGWYDADVSWCGARVGFSLSVEQEDELPEAIAVARALLDAAPEWQARMSEAMVRDLLELKNGEWLDPEHDPAPYIAETFLAPLKLEGATTLPDGTAEFFFDDGDLFFGHSLIVALDTASGRASASLGG